MALEADFGIVCSVKVHLIRDGFDEDQVPDEAVVEFGCGVNTVPTRTQLEQFRKEAIAAVKDAAGGEWRLSTIMDRGFAEPVDMKWRAEDPAQ